MSGSEDMPTCNKQLPWKDLPRQVQRRVTCVLCKVQYTFRASLFCSCYETGKPCMLTHLISALTVLVSVVSVNSCPSSWTIGLAPVGVHCFFKLQYGIVQNAENKKILLKLVIVCLAFPLICVLFAQLCSVSSNNIVLWFDTVGVC